MTSPWDVLELTAAGEGRYLGELTAPWTLARVPQGGIVASLAVEAMVAELGDEEQRLRTHTSVFAGPVAVGPVEIDVTVLRRGRSMSQFRAEVRNPGAAAGLTVLAVFGRNRLGPAFVELEPPEVEGPDGLRSFRDPLPPEVDPDFFGEPRPFWAEVCETRPALGRPPWEPFEDGPSDVVQWYRYEGAPVRPDGTFHQAVPIVACDMMPGSVSQKIGELDRPWFGPSTDYTQHVFDPAPAGWLLGHLRAHAAGDGYASVEMTLWSEQRTLVAWANQVMFFTFFD